MVQLMTRRAYGRQSKAASVGGLVAQFRLSLMACVASRWRLRFLCDRRRLADLRTQLLNLGQCCWSAFPGNLG
jgi:hypothetical protein